MEDHVLCLLYYKIITIIRDINVRKCSSPFADYKFHSMIMDANMIM